MFASAPPAPQDEWRRRPASRASLPQHLSDENQSSSVALEPIERLSARPAAPQRFAGPRPNAPNSVRLGWTVARPFAIAPIQSFRTRACARSGTQGIAELCVCSWIPGSASGRSGMPAELGVREALTTSLPDKRVAETASRSANARDVPNVAL